MKGFPAACGQRHLGAARFFLFAQYLDLLAQNYGAGLRLLDFVKAAEQSRQTINQWVSDQTEKKI